MKNRKKKKFNVTVLLSLALTAIIIFSVAGIHYGVMMPLSPVKTIINELSGYTGELMSHPVNALNHVWRTYIDLIDVKEKNRILQAQLLDLQAENTGYREIILENRRLKHLLEIEEKYSGNTVVANVTGYDLVTWAGTITVDKGKEDGIKKDNIVLYGRYAAGRVTESFIHFSRVMLITAADSAVAAIIQRNRARGILYGSGEGSCLMEFIEKDVRVEVGDTVITSGTDAIFPKGIILGRVIAIKNAEEQGLFKSVSVKPSVNLSRLEEVIMPTENSELIPEQ